MDSNARISSPPDHAQNDGQVEYQPRPPAVEESTHPLNGWGSESNIQNSHIYDAQQHQRAEERFDQLRERHNQRHTSRAGSHHIPMRGTLPWRERVKHTTWAYFTMTMATGGLANVLYVVPFHNPWLHHIGLCFFFLNITLYIIIWAMLLMRFASYPSTFRASLIHPTESLFVPAFAVSLGTISITIIEYGAENTGPWLTHVVWVVFWFNLALAMILSISIYMILWSSLTFTIAQMTPIWIFPAYPLLIIGPHAANLSRELESPHQALQVIIAGFTVQGIGFLVSLTIYSAFVYRLMTQKLPADPSRPGMFVSVGPAAFTCSGTIGMAANLETAITGSRGPSDNNEFMDVPTILAAQVLRLVANWASLWLWGLALWFFFVSAISNIAPLFTHEWRQGHESLTASTEESQPQSQQQSREKHTRKSTPGRSHGLGHPPMPISIHTHKIPFSMTWYSYIFPQTALTTATFRIAAAFDIYPLVIVGCVMTVLLVAMWVFVMGMMGRAIVLKQILWPERGEDREEGGFRNKTR